MPFDILSTVPGLIDLFDDAFIKGNVEQMTQCKINLEKTITDPTWNYEIKNLDKKYLDLLKKQHNEFNTTHKALLNTEFKDYKQLDTEFTKIDIEFKTDLIESLKSYWETFISKTKTYIRKEYEKKVDNE